MVLHAGQVGLGIHVLHMAIHHVNLNRGPLGLYLSGKGGLFKGDFISHPGRSKDSYTQLVVLTHAILGRTRQIPNAVVQP